MWVWVVAASAAVLGVLVFRLVTAPARRRNQAVAIALRQASEEVARCPEDPGAKVKLARVLLDLAGRPAEALALLEALDRADPRLWAAGERPAKFLFGEACAAAGRLEQALEAFQAFIASLPQYDTGGDSERKWLLETHKVEAEQRIRLLRRGDTHVHQPEQWRSTQD
ncbi:MAG: hypothetical protein HY812_00010 [Planctomycetes bacterium]|nr:hypothetical protein [Planctomycetota bacterium]